MGPRGIEPRTRRLKDRGLAGAVAAGAGQGATHGRWSGYRRHEWRPFAPIVIPTCRPLAPTNGSCVGPSGLGPERIWCPRSADQSTTVTVSGPLARWVHTSLSNSKRRLAAPPHRAPTLPQPTAPNESRVAYPLRGTPDPVPSGSVAVQAQVSGTGGSARNPAERRRTATQTAPRPGLARDELVGELPLAAQRSGHLTPSTRDWAFPQLTSVIVPCELSAAMRAVRLRARRVVPRWSPALREDPATTCGQAPHCGEGWRGS
jgi:hypothetical protein